MSENPKCPYCGEEMKFSYGYDGYMNGHYWYRCDNCNALAPEANSPEEARAAAMKRERARGEWIYKERHEHYPSGKPYTARYCGVCGRRDHNEDSDYCGYCGADMRKENKDE